MEINRRHELYSTFWGLTDKQWTRSGLTLAEGVTLGKRLLASDLVPEAVYCLAEHEEVFTALVAGRCEVNTLTKTEMDKWAGFAFHRGVVVIGRRPPPVSLEAFLNRTPRPLRLAVAPDLTDPENLGSIFRSALALGWDAVAIGPRSCDPFSRRASKVSMGGVYAHTPVELPEDAGETRRLFEAAGWTVKALSLEPDAEELEGWAQGASGQTALRGPLALYVGNEFQGISEDDRRVCSGALVLPMDEGHDSLNAAVAAGIAFYRLSGRRK